MPRFTDFESSTEIKDIMEAIVERFSSIFDGFDIDGFRIIHTKKKKSPKALKLRGVGYPMVEWVGKPYIIEAFQCHWKDMDARKKNLAVFHIMCAIPEGGFDEASKTWAKVRKPEISMYMLEFAACGGVPNGHENPAAIDPMERTIEEIAGAVPMAAPTPATQETEPAIIDDGVNRTPVKAVDVANVRQETDAA